VIVVLLQVGNSQLYHGENKLPLSRSLLPIRPISGVGLL